MYASLGMMLVGGEDAHGEDHADFDGDADAADADADADVDAADANADVDANAGCVRTLLVLGTRELVLISEDECELTAMDSGRGDDRGSIKTVAPVGT